MVRVGVDFGQKLDPSAIVAVEVQSRDYTLNPYGRPVRGVTHYVARSIQRLPLGTSYPAVARRLAEIETKLRDRGLWSEFWVDATGVGQPVVDLLSAAGLTVTPVYLTGSDQVTKGEHGETRMGKAPMVSRLQVLLQLHGGWPARRRERGLHGSFPAADGVRDPGGEGHQVAQHEEGRPLEHQGLPPIGGAQHHPSRREQRAEVGAGPAVRRDQLVVVVQLEGAGGRARTLAGAADGGCTHDRE
jgi:hypothetical protein